MKVNTILLHHTYINRHMLIDDFELVLERAKKAGVERLIITGTNLADSKEAIEMTKQPGHSKQLDKKEDEQSTNGGEPLFYLIL